MATVSTNVSSKISAAEAQHILNQHNCARQRYGLSPLTWDWQLAASAQDHANQCVWSEPPSSAYGENMAMSMGAPVNIDGWLVEEEFFNCVSNQCLQEPCGHWTQVAWSGTKNVGCGKQTCARVQDAPGFLNAEIIVCRYTPPGNYIGQRMCTKAQCALGATNKTCGPIPAPAPTPAPTRKPKPQPQPQPEPQPLPIESLPLQLEPPPSPPPPPLPAPAPLPIAIPVTPDPRITGYPPIETLQQSSQLSTTLIIVIAAVCVLVILIIVALGYWQRERLARVSRRALQKLQRHRYNIQN